MNLKFSKDHTAWALRKIKPLLRLYGAPKDQDAQERFASAVLRIAHPQLVFLRCLDLDFPNERLMDLLRILPGEMEAIAAEDSALAKALTARNPPRNWVKNPSGEIPYLFIKGALKLPVEELEKIEVTSAKLKPVDWLVDTAYDRFSRFFPDPVDLRRIHLERMPCADGVNNVPIEQRKKGED